MRLYKGTRRWTTLTSVKRMGKERSRHPIFSFEEFLRTGALGPIRCGMTEGDVQKAIGLPPRKEDIETYPTGRSVWTYFPLSFGFQSGTLNDLGLGFTWWDGKFPPNFSFEGFLPGTRTKMEEVQQFLESKRIEFEVGNDGRTLRTSAGVWIHPTVHDNTIMSATKECAGPTAFMDRRFRNFEKVMNKDLEHYLCVWKRGFAEFLGWTSKDTENWAKPFFEPEAASMMITQMPVHYIARVLSDQQLNFEKLDQRERFELIERVEAICSGTGTGWDFPAWYNFDQARAKIEKVFSEVLKPKGDQED